MYKLKFLLRLFFFLVFSTSLNIKAVSLSDIIGAITPKKTIDGISYIIESYIVDDIPLSRALSRLIPLTLIGSMSYYGIYRLVKNIRHYYKYKKLEEGGYLNSKYLSNQAISLKRDFQEMTWAVGIDPSKLIVKYSRVFKVEQYFPYNIIAYDKSEKERMAKSMFGHELMHLKNYDRYKRYVAWTVVPSLALATCLKLSGERKPLKNITKLPLKYLWGGCIGAFYLIRYYEWMHEIVADIGSAYLCGSAKGSIEYFEKTKDRYSHLKNFLTGQHPHYKFRIAYLSLWQKLYDRGIL